MPDPAYAKDAPGETYEAGCHCGYISLSVTLRPGLDDYVITECNCSICRRAGYLLTYPYKEDVIWHNNSRERCSVYQFNTKKKDQLFCGKCGASIGIDFREVINPPRYGISARAYNGIDLRKLKFRQENGLGEVQPAEDLSGREHSRVEGEKA